MVLAGLVIALGVVVDDAIIDVQNIVRRLRERRKEGTGKSTAATVLEASLEVRSPIVYATLIIVVAMVPIFFLQGLTGAFFRPLALSYVLAVGVSLITALTVTPALSLILLRNAPLERRESPLAQWLERGYQRILARVVSRPARAYVAVRRSRWPQESRWFRTSASRWFPPSRSGTSSATGSRSRARRFVSRIESSPEQVGSCGRFQGSTTSARTSGRPSWPTRPWESTSARTGSRSTPPRTTTRRSTRFRASSTAIPGSSTTSRRI